MFTSLKIQDFKCHENVELAFKPGLNLLIGPNYKGKSSVLHAILYALWGVSAVPGGREVVVREGANKEQVELGFTLYDARFHVNRSGNSATVTKNDVVVAKSASAVTAYLEDLLGMTKERFLQLRYGEQKETEALLTLGVPKLHSIIEEISGAEVVTEVITKASRALSEANGGLDALPSSTLEETKHEEEAIRLALITLQDRIETDSIKVGSLNESTIHAHVELQSAKDLNSSIDEQRRRLEALRVERERWVDVKTQAQDELIDTDTLHLQLSAALVQRDHALGYYNQVEAASRSRTAASRSVDMLTQRSGITRALVEKSAEGLEDAPEYEDPTTLRDTSEDTVIAFRLLKQDRSRVLTAMKDGVCPACMRPFEGYDHTDLEEQRKRIDADILLASEAKLAAKANLETVETNNQLLKDMRARLESDQKTLDSQEVDLIKAQEELQSLRDSDTDIAAAKATLTGWIAEVDRLTWLQAEIRNAKRSLDGAEKGIALADDQINQLGEIPVKLDTDQLEDTYETALDAYSAASQALEFLQGSYKGQSTAWEHAKRMLEAAQRVEVTRAALVERKAGVDDLVKYLRKNRDRFLSKIWDGIMGYASNFASACTDGSIERILRNDNGTFAYREMGSDRPIKAASGAQRSIMGLGVQLAMAQMLPSPLSALLLDEPTADLDPERSLAMAALLSTESNQVVMVSHRELDGAVAAEVFDMGALA